MVKTVTTEDIRLLKYKTTYDDKWVSFEDYKEMKKEFKVIKDLLRNILKHTRKGIKENERKRIL